MATKNISIDLTEATLQAATERAQLEGRTLDAVVAELLTTYAGGEPEPVLTTYTVKRGDSLARIAREIYGDPHKYPLLQQANNLTDPGRIWVGQVLVVPSLAGPKSTPAPAPAPPTPAPVVTPPVPAAPATPPTPAPPVQTPPPAAPPTPAPPVTPPTLQPAPLPPEPPAPPKVDPCAAIAGQNYGTLPIVGPPTDRPADKHGDINLALRGYEKTGAKAGLIDMSGPTDHRAPQLASLFADKRTPEFTAVYRVNNWDWGRNARGNPVTDFEVSLAGLKVAPGEVIGVPKADYDIGQGYQVLVLYASQERITLKYTGEDSVVSGYAIHVDGVCVEPGLLALYQKMNAEGRRKLPALRAEQPLGRARGPEIQVAIRDTGRFMDPRVRKDWWRGR